MLDRNAQMKQLFFDPWKKTCSNFICYEMFLAGINIAAIDACETTKENINRQMSEELLLNDRRGNLIQGL